MLSGKGIGPADWPARLLGSAVLLIAAITSSGALFELKAQSPSASQVKTVAIPVEGMSCISCAARVKRTLKGIEGVQQVEVSLERRETVVRFAPAKVTPERLESAINELGYKAGKSRVVESK